MEMGEDIKRTISRADPRISVLQMLKDEKVDLHLSRGIDHSLGQLIESVSDCKKLFKTLNILDTRQSVFNALHVISKRKGYVIFSNGRIKEA